MNQFTKIKSKPTFIVIGAGIIGITIAREAALSKLFGKIIIIEKEKLAGYHSTSRNSGVIHSGFYYSPESKKAKFCADGNRLMRKYILDNSLSFNSCGKVVVSKNESEDQTIKILENRGQINNCKVKLFNASDLKKYEPAAKTNNFFLWSPNTWSASPKEILNCLLKEIKEYGVELYLGRKVNEARKNLIILDDGHKLKYDFLVNVFNLVSFNGR